MPLYEYKCLNCKNITEALQKFSDPPLDNCPKCNGKLKKIISQSGFVLKGSGWYVTDYKNKNVTSTDTSKSKKNKKTAA